jgi:hypothetical protein
MSESNTTYDGGVDKEIVSQSAVAVSEGNKLFVSLIDNKISYAPRGTINSTETLTFFGDYFVENDQKDLTELEKYERKYDIRLGKIFCSHSRVEKKREANGVIEFQRPGFRPNDDAKFEATKVENCLKHDYDVTISITGLSKAGEVRAEVRNFILSSIITTAELRVVA